ncbi:MAG: DoxX family protein [Bacteroidia bacterium]
MEYLPSEGPTYLDFLPVRIIGLLILLFFAVLFIQSGLDKVTDRKGNLDWLKGHFSKSIFGGMVPLLLSVLTLLEIASGLFSLVAGIWWMLDNEMRGFWPPFVAVTLCGFTLLQLFTGQRVAKDYAGAAGIVPYFVVAIIGMAFFGFWAVEG